MSKSLPYVVTLTRTFPTSAKRLYSLWTERAALLQWSELRNCRLDVRVGGKYRFEFPTAPGQEDVTNGKFSVVNPRRRLEFTWDGLSPSGPTGETLVTLDFKVVASGCKLRLRHAFARKQSMIECKTGWQYWFDSLAKFVKQENVKV